MNYCAPNCVILAENYVALFHHITTSVVIGSVILCSTLNAHTRGNKCSVPFFDYLTQSFHESAADTPPNNADRLDTHAASAEYCD